MKLKFTAFYKTVIVGGTGRYDPITKVHITKKVYGPPSIFELQKKL